MTYDSITPYDGRKNSCALDGAETQIHFHTANNPKVKTWAAHVTDWPGFASYLKGEVEVAADQPPGPAFVPAALKEGQLRKTAVVEINVAVVEIEGVELPDIRAQLNKRGWTYAIASLWANGRTETQLPHDDLVKWLDKKGHPDHGGAEINPLSIAYYLREVRGWREVAETVEIADARGHAKEGGCVVVIRHSALPAYLVSVPLSEPFRPVAAKTHAGGIKWWGDVLGTVARSVSGRIALSKEARDPAAKVNVPRVRPDGVPFFEVVEGETLDWRDLVPEPTADSAPIAGKGKARAHSEPWMDRLILTEKGAIVSNLPNLHMILSNDPRTVGTVGFNVFTGEIVLREAPGQKPDAVVQLDGADWKVRDSINGDLWSDAHDDALRAMLEAAEEDGGYDLRVTDRDLAAAVHLTAKANPFHPVRDYLDGLIWDGTPRVENVFVSYLGAPDDAYHREVAKLMMVGAVARAFEPGMKIDESVILEGLQGARKTTFIETMAVHWYGELDAGMDDSKGAVEQMQGCWIMEMGELTGLAKSDIRRAKAFLSRHTDKARLAYARRAREFPRACIFIGSTNDQAYLKDPTGGRRFLPVACRVAGTIDIERLRGEIDQLWAEAVHLYRQMRQTHPTGRLPLWLSDDAARETARTLQASRTIDTADDMIAGQVEDWLQGRQKVCLRQVWEECLGRDLDHYTNAWAATLGQIMRAVPGWEATGTRESFVGYGQQRAFERVKAA